ncbi:MAG: ATP synthase subunit I [Steroidobacteraceae bacterium]
MIQTRASDVGRLAARILIAQVAITVILAALCYGVWGVRHGESALAGGSIGFIANLFMTLTALRPGGGAGLVLGRVLLGQFVKVALTVAMFVALARTGKAVWPPVIATYVATLVVFWVVPVLAGPRLPPRSMG